MQSNRFQKVAVMTLAVMLLSMAFFSSAQAGFLWRDHNKKGGFVRNVEVDMDFIFGQTASFVSGSDKTSLDLNDGFRISAAYGSKIFIGLSLTSYAQGSTMHGQGSGEISRTRLSVPAYIVTPWMRFWNRDFAACRGKFGFMFDLTGLATKFSSSENIEVNDGRLREHLAFFSFEVSPLVIDGSAFFIRVSYARSIFGYSSAEGEGRHSFYSGADNHIYLGVGGSIQL